MMDDMIDKSEHIERIQPLTETDVKLHRESIEQRDVPPSSADNEDLSQSIILEIDLNGFTLPLMSVLEALLFVSDGAVEISHLAKVLNLDSEVVRAAIQALRHQYSMQKSGLKVQGHNGCFRLVTHPQLAPLIEDYLSLDLTAKLSVPALETLAIIAYRQPVTRAQIEAVRGVDTSAMLRSLIQRGLIEEAGRLELVGRPILYSVTEEFLQHFGLTDLNELPQLEISDADTLWATTKLAELQESNTNSS